MKRLGRIGVLLLAFALLMGSMLLLDSCFFFGGNEPYKFTYDAPEKYTAGGTVIDDLSENKNLHIRWYQGKVTVRTHDEPTIVIEETLNKEVEDKYRVHWWYSPTQTLGTTTFIEFSASEELDFEGITKDLTVTIPRTANISISVSGYDLDADIDVSDYQNTLRKFSFSTETGSLNARIDSADTVQISGYNEDEGDAENRIFALTATGRVSWLGMNSSYAKIKADLNRVDSMDAIGSTFADTEFSCREAKDIKILGKDGKITVTAPIFDSIEVTTYLGETVLNLAQDAAFSLAVSEEVNYEETDIFSVAVNYEGVRQENGKYIVGDGTKPIAVKTAGVLTVNPIHS